MVPPILRRLYTRYSLRQFAALAGVATVARMTWSPRATRLSRSQRRWLVGAGIYVLVVTILVWEGRSEPVTADGRHQDAWAYVILAVATVALLFRRRAPLLVAGLAVAALTLWYSGVGYEGRAINIPYLVALYTVAVTGSTRRTAVVGVVVSLLAVARVAIAGSGFIGAANAIGWTLAALLFGETVRARAEFASAAESRADRAEAERELEVERRVTDERLRIARELHDVIAHTVSVMTVQAGVAADALEDPPEQVSDALMTVRAASREANRELRAIVGLLRRPDGTSDLAPAPRLADIAELVRNTENAGISTDVAESGRRRALPALVELTAYRVVQEALTNVVRHANASTASVYLDFGDDELGVEIIDDGSARASANGTGFGLRGMSERVGSLGGTINYGPRQPRGFRVNARLPLGNGS